MQICKEIKNMSKAQKVQKFELKVWTLLSLLFDFKGHKGFSVV